MALAREKQESELNLALVGMLMMSAVCAVISSLCFIVVRSWPLPVSVAPYFGGREGLVWGAVVGAVLGLAIGYLTDEKHFTDIEE